MYLFWRLFHWLNTLKSAHWVTFGPRYFLATVLVASAALVAIGAIAAFAKIAFNEQSWVALIVLLVTEIQVRDIRIITKLVCGPSGLLDFVLRALRALRPCDPRDNVSDSEKSK